MKKLRYLLLSISIISCGADDDGNAPENVASGQYFFEIELGGEVHRIEGDNQEMFLNGQNSCSAYLLNGIQSIGFKLSDITAPDFISGQPLDIAFGIINPQIGSNNTGVISFQNSLYSDFLNNFGDQNNITFWFDEFVENTPMDINNYDGQRSRRISNITLTNLGTPPNAAMPGPSTNIQGYYQGTLYFLDDRTVGTPEASWNVPIPIRISFSAVRGN